MAADADVRSMGIVRKKHGQLATAQMQKRLGGISVKGHIMFLVVGRKFMYEAAG